jgi:AraC-like DNA-binding protein
VSPLVCNAMAADLEPIPVALFARLERAGLDVGAVLRRANLPRSQFNVASPLGTTAQFFALWRAVEESNADPSLGLRLGVKALTDPENFVALSALHSPTIGDGLQKLARYKRMVCPDRLTMEVDDGEARLLLKWLFAEGSPPTLLVDLVFAGVLRLVQQGTRKPVKPLRLEVTRRRANEARLRRHFRCDVRFDAPHDALVFDQADLALPMVNRNAQFLAVLLPGLEDQFAQQGRTRSLTDDVRMALTDLISGERPAVTRVARSLGMSSRTLQRRLEQLGTTYQRLLDDVRRQLAVRMLTDTDLGMGEVAFLLGFGEVNSFSRAFQGWEGTTPSQWRAHRRRGELAARRHKRTPTT